jgi:hypothetical protein
MNLLYGTTTSLVVTIVEYLLPDVQGPNAASPELHLQKLHFEASQSGRLGQ